jgi:RNA polymerase sigma-70 factor (ECF subfamily)
MAPRRKGLEVLRPPEAEVDDAELVERARAHEAWAREMLYRRHVERVAAVGRRLLRNVADTEDIVQETFLIAFERLDQLEEPAAVRGWLARIAVSRAHRRFRRRRLMALLGRREPEEALEDQADPGASPEQLAELRLLDRALSALPLNLRVPWVLRHVVGHTLEDTAVACGCSLATAKRRIAAADARMRAVTHD